MRCVYGGSQGSRTMNFAKQRRKSVKKAPRANRARSSRPWEGGHVQTSEKKQAGREVLAWLVLHPRHAP